MIVRFKNDKRIDKKYVSSSNDLSDLGLQNTVGYEADNYGRTNNGGNICCRYSNSDHLWRHSRYSLFLQTNNRTILRCSRNLQTKWISLVNPPLPLQRRLCRSRFLVHRSRSPLVLPQSSLSHWCVSQPRQPRDRRYEQSLRLRR